MAYIATYIVLFLALMARALAIKKKDSSPGRYYSYPEGTWARVFCIPLLVCGIMYTVFPHNSLVRGGIKTEVVKRMETETLILESVHKYSVDKTGTTSFWWGRPIGGHSSRYLEITNKIDSSKVIVDRFTSLENYAFKQTQDE